MVRYVGIVRAINKTERAMTTGKRKWRVDFVSGSYVADATVEAYSVTGAIDEAIYAMTDHDGDASWPNQASEATITVRVVE